MHACAAVRRVRMASAVALALATAACGSHANEVAQHVQAPRAAAVVRTSATPSPLPSPRPSPPPAAATMVCSDELRGKVAQLAGAARIAAGVPTWRDGVFRCEYRVDGRPLTLTVRVGVSGADAGSYAAQFRRTLGTTHTIRGLASFGLPAYETDSGVVVFVKGADVLVIDARALGEATGPARHTREDFAYTVASDVISCWNGD